MRLRPAATAFAALAVLAMTACGSPAPTSSPVTAAACPAAAVTPGENRFTAYLTGYDWWDNTPPGAAISNPVVNPVAGGDGSYAAPITLAVGHCFDGERDVLDIAEGTRFYVPNLRRFFIVEDTCGDGATPQDGPCHDGHDGHVWLDLWVDGRADTSSGHAESAACMDAITGDSLVIGAPAESYAVEPGPLYDTTCTEQYGDAVVSR